MPMVDDAEFAEVTALNPHERLKDPLAYVLKEYERVTGFKETNPNAVLHHKISLYGPPCKKCGRPLRTPQAKLCGSCMMPAGEPV
jgi:hypothetical protein